MADPLGFTASLLGVVTAALQSSKSLYATVQRFKGRDKTLRRLDSEIHNLTAILDSLTQAIDGEQAILKLLKDPIERCSQECREFEKSMEAFGGKASKASFLDWTKMEFRRGSINEFIDTVAEYKSTISLAVGTINMSYTSKISREVIQEFNEMVQDTAYTLELRLQQIEEKMTQLNLETVSAYAGANIDLEDEKAVTMQCLRVCKEARSYVESLAVRESAILADTARVTRSTTTAQDITESSPFDAQLRTREAMANTIHKFTETMAHIQNRLLSLVQEEGSPEKDRERSQLQADLAVSKQCLEVCKLASEASRQKVLRIGEAIAEGDSSHAVVDSAADLLDIRKIQSKDHSILLVGSIAPENIDKLIEKHYSSSSSSSRSPAVSEAQTSNHAAAAPSTSDNLEHSPAPRAKQDKPTPNEMRKRKTDG